MRKTIRHCQSRGTREIVGRSAADNEATLELARKLGFEEILLPDPSRHEVRLKLN